jgi:hypothetical protein
VGEMRDPLGFVGSDDALGSGFRNDRSNRRQTPASVGWSARTIATSSQLLTRVASFIRGTTTIQSHTAVADQIETEEAHDEAIDAGNFRFRLM